MSKAYIPERTTWHPNKAYRNSQITFKRGDEFANMWSALSAKEKATWNKKFQGTTYSGYVGAYFCYMRLSQVSTMAYEKQQGHISVSEYQSVVSENWYDFVVNYP